MKGPALEADRVPLEVSESGSRMIQRALELAYRCLSRRERTVSEVRRYLLARGIEDRDAAGAIGELIEQGYLDDARFARLFVQDKRALERWGSQRIIRSLLSRGVDRELVDAALDFGGGGGDAGSELERALGLLRQRFPVPPQGRRDRDRALGLLLRKGYGPDLVLDALREHARGQR